MRGDHDAMADFAKRRAEAVRWWRRPDPDYADFSTWFDSLLEEVFVTDALALYIQPSLGKRKGLLGSSLAALDLIDGTLIKPLIDVRGSKPPPPNPAFQQFSYGVPRVDLMTLLTGEDDPEDRHMVAEYRGDQLMYLPYSQRTWTPYGMAPIERAIIPIMAGLNKQAYQLNFFQEGSIPGLFISPGDPNMTPAQIRELQDALNALAGDQTWKHKIIVLPGGSKVDPQKPAELADQFDEIIMTQTCMAFSVMPMELGISPGSSSSQSSGAAQQMAKMSQDVQERKGTIPLLLWLKTSVFDRVLQGICGQDDMEWQWEGLEEDEDAETLTNLLTQQISTGMRSIDEARQELGLDPWGLDITSMPGWSTERTGFVSFTATGPLPTADPGNSEGGAGSGPPAGAAGAAGQPALPAPDPRPKPVTPAHSAADATPDAARARPRPAAKSEMAGWLARDIPAHVMAIIAEDLSKGLTSDEVCLAARALVGTDKAALRELGLLRSHLRKSGDQAGKVHAYLSKHYPPSVLGWVREASWAAPQEVSLKQIDMARRPGGARNPQKVRAIAAAIQDGQELDPVVLVETPGGVKYEIADGWHRTLAVKHAGRKKVLAWVGKVGSDDGPWGGQMHRAKLNKADDGPDDDEDGGAGPKVRCPVWDHDQALAAEYARRLGSELQQAIHAPQLAAAWLSCRNGPKAAGTRLSARQFLASLAVPAAFSAVLAAVLRQLWAAGWNLGWRSALSLLLDILGGRPRHLRGESSAMSADALARLAAEALHRIPGMARTRIRRLERVLEDAPDDISAEALAALIDAELSDASDTGLVTQTEITWAVSEAMTAVYYEAGISAVAWQTEDDARVCAGCLENQAEGYIPLGDAFSGTGDTMPPAHPRCRCALIPGATVSHFA
jgi:hypothetical protein